MLTAEERLKWWHETRFGMFIHWGLYAIPAGEWNGEKIPGIGEWIMFNGKIPIEDYEKLADDFNPVKFNADEWAQLAQDAGMKYLVITSKHHDGFCMFDSPSNPYNIVNKTPFKRDPMKELAEACNKRGIKMCFYYSQDLDWHAPGGSGHWEEIPEGSDWIKHNPSAESFQKYLDELVKPNLRELLTNYGPVGLIWFDCPVTISKEQSEDLRDFVHELQPECLVSGRIGNDVGDYGSLGDNEHPTGAVEGAWETPATLNDTWGFKEDDHNWKSLEFLLDLLVNCASKGVNYLLNVGPTAEGVIPKPSADLLRQVGEWLDRNGEAIYGTTATPFPIDPEWGRITKKGNSIYLLVKQWPAGKLQLTGLNNEVKKVRILGSDAEVGVERDGDALMLSLPEEAPEEIVSVIALDLDGIPDVEPIVIQEGTKAITLPVHCAEVEGNMEVKPSGRTENWTDSANCAKWTFRVVTPGNYKVTAVARVNRNCLDEHSYPELTVTISGSTLTSEIDYSGIDNSEGAKVYQLVKTDLGQVNITAAGDHQISLTADKFDKDIKRGLNLVSIELTPVE